MAKIYGIDVSHHQGTINWQQTAAELRRVNGGASPGFAILRVGYSARHGKGGLYTDGQFLANVAGCEQYGVPMGAYWYCYDTTAAAAKLTAQQVVRMLAGHKFDYPIFFDVEYGTNDGTASGYRYDSTANRANNTAIIQAALGELEAAGYYAAVYCSRDFFLNYTNLAQLSGFDKWEAAYTSSDTAAVSNGMWQYSSSNPLGIAGFGSSLDCDVAYKDYPAIMAANGLNGYAAEAPQPESNAGDANTAAPQLQRVSVRCADSEDGAQIGRLLATLQVPILAELSPGDALNVQRVAQTLGDEYHSEYV